MKKICAFIFRSFSVNIPDYLNDYPFHPPEDAEAEISETSKPEEIRLLAGSDLSIKCKAPTCQERDSLHWEFKASAIKRKTQSPIQNGCEQ